MVAQLGFFGGESGSGGDGLEGGLSRGGGTTMEVADESMPGFSGGLGLMM
jgi:hypothetical protein